jgi:hypothetical protein
VDCQERQHRPAERRDEAGLQHHAERPGLQQLVAPVPGRQAERGEALALQRPAAAHRAGDLAQREPVDALAHPRARRILGRGDVAMVAAVVLDAEVPVEGHGEHDPGEHALEHRLLVAELVAGVDPQPGVDAHGVREQQEAPPRQRLRAGPDRAADQRDEMQRHDQVGEHPVVGIGLQRGHHRLGRIALVLAEQPVEQRADAVADDDRQQQPGLVPRPRVQRDASERQQRVDDRQQPPAAAPVAPGHAEALRIDRRVDDAHGCDLVRFRT